MKMALRNMTFGVILTKELSKTENWQTLRMLFTLLAVRLFLDAFSSIVLSMDLSMKKFSSMFSSSSSIHSSPSDPMLSCWITLQSSSESMLSHSMSSDLSKLSNSFCAADVVFCAGGFLAQS